jgi:hypothetical protein
MHVKNLFYDSAVHKLSSICTNKTRSSVKNTVFKISDSTLKLAAVIKSYHLVMVGRLNNCNDPDDYTKEIMLAG